MTIRRAEPSTSLDETNCLKAWKKLRQYWEIEQKFVREGMIFQGLSSSIEEFFNRLSHSPTSILRQVVW